MSYDDKDSVGSDSSLSAVDPDNDKTIGEVLLASVELDPSHLYYTVRGFLAKVTSLRACILESLFLPKETTLTPDQHPKG